MSRRSYHLRLGHGDLPESLLSVMEKNDHEDADRYGSLESICDTPVRLSMSAPRKHVANFVNHVCKHLSFNDRQRICSAIDVVSKTPEILQTPVRSAC
jgi:hypothetical protein